MKCKVARRWNLEQCWTEKSHAQSAHAQQTSRVWPIAQTIVQMRLLFSWISGNLSCFVFGKAQLPWQYRKECALYAFHIWLHYIYRISCITQNVWQSWEKKMWHFLLSFTLLLLSPHFRTFNSYLLHQIQWKWRRDYCFPSVIVMTMN